MGLNIERTKLLRKQRHVDSSGQMIFSKFEGSAGINDAVAVEKVRVEGYGFWHNKDSLSAEV